MTKRSVVHHRFIQQGEFLVRTDRTVLAKDVLIAINHARNAMVRHRITASFVNPEMSCSITVVSPRTLMEFVKGLME